MTTATIHDAKTHFSKYLREVEQGKEIVIKRRNIPIARLLPYDLEEKKKKNLSNMTKSVVKNNLPRNPVVFGELKGKVWMADDFNDSMEDLFSDDLYHKE